VIHLAVPLPFLPGTLAVALGVPLVAAAIALFSYSVAKFKAAGTPVPARKPTTVIVRTGPHRFSRNPICLAFSVFQLGIAVWVNSVWLLATLVGAVASPAAMVEFYTGAAIGVWSAGHDTLTPAQVQADVQLVGRVSATIPPGSAAMVSCPKYWVPGSVHAAEQGVLVQVRDLFTDPLTTPFDAVNDRHVARFDAVMDPYLRGAHG